jgi:hypothetical protein
MSQRTPEIPHYVIDPTVPSIARVYDHWLGGKDNYEADRKVGDAAIGAYPPIRDLVLHNRRLKRSTSLSPSR